MGEASCGGRGEGKLWLVGLGRRVICVRPGGAQRMRLPDLKKESGTASDGMIGKISSHVF